MSIDQCPRCHGRLRAYPTDGGAQPRAKLDDPGVTICADCGRDEAIRAAQGLPLPPQSAWPVGGRLTSQDLAHITSTATR